MSPGLACLGQKDVHWGEKELLLLRINEIALTHHHHYQERQQPRATGDIHREQEGSGSYQLRQKEESWRLQQSKRESKGEEEVSELQTYHWVKLRAKKG